ncbi:MAG: hypothetical protein IH965_14885 [Gemmatimonadetes bacterium]|nr:hypothetical protein [Gemmatimonadota bacterium]
MERIFRRAIAAAAMAFVFASCGDETLIFPGGPAGPAVAIDLSTSLFVLRIGESVTIGMQGRDETGNPIISGATPSISSSNSSVASVVTGAGTEAWASTATVSGLAWGETTLKVTLGSLEELLTVRVGPAGVIITGPDQVLSGAAAAFGLEFFDGAGNTVTPPTGFVVPELESLNEFRLPLTASSDVAYDAAGQQPGFVTLQVAMSPDFGGATASKRVEVVPGVFGGTISATTAAVQGGPITVTRAGNRTWDGDETIQIGGVVQPSWDGTAASPAFPTWDPDALTFYVSPFTAAGTYDLTIVDQGAGQIAEAVSFTVTGAFFTNHQGFPGLFTPGATLEDKPLPLRFSVVHDASAVTRTYYTMAPVGFDYQFTALLEFPCPGDIDIQFIDGGFTAFIGDRSGETLECPEATVWRVVDGDFNFLAIQSFFSVITPAHVTLFPGCVAGIENGDEDAVEDTDNWEDAGCDD